jgi:alkylation response protein AidB-like acyl-CoA dehydrogenase
MHLEPTPAQRDFQERIGRFADEHVAPRAAAIDERDEYPSDLVTLAGELGLMGVTVPAADGGLGLDYVAYALGIEAVARASATLAVILAVNNSLVAETVVRFGTPAQKARWLRALATGRTVGAFALSEEHAGTDAANQETTATRDGDGYVLNGRKVWVANAEVAGVAIVFAATTPGIGGRGVSAFLVPTSAPGLIKVPKRNSLGVRGLGCLDLVFDDVRVDEGDRLGEEGGGFRLAMWALDGGRVAIGAQALGVGQAAMDEALDHARRRHAFGEPIANFQAIQWMLADMATELDAARLLVLKGAAAKSQQDRCPLEASMGKLAASEAAHRAADKAMQILASAGYSRGSRVERLFRDVRATEIYQGTSEVQRMIIASQILPSVD